MQLQSTENNRWPLKLMLESVRNSLKQHSDKHLPYLDPVTRGWAVIFSGTAARMGLSFLTGIVIVRTFGPADFGVYSLLLAVVGIVGVIVDFGLTETAVKKIAELWSGDRYQALRQAQVFFWLRVGLALGGVGLCLALAQPISRYLLQLTNDGWLLSVALLSVVTTALNGSVTAILQGTNYFGRISVAMVISSALALLLAVILVLIDRLTLATALLGIGAGTALAGFWVGQRLLPNDWGDAGTSPLTFPGKTIIRAEGPPFLRFGRWLWLANILKTLSAYLDFFLLNLWLTPAVVGIYALALGLSARVETVNHSLYTVLIPMASALKGRAALVNYLRQGFKRSGLISLVLLGLLIPLAVWFIPFFYGEAFRPATRLFQLLLGVLIFDIFTLPPLLLIYTFDRPDLSALAEGLRVVTLIITAIWLIPLLGPLGAIVAKFMAKIVGVLVTIFLLWPHYKRVKSP